VTAAENKNEKSDTSGNCDLRWEVWVVSARTVQSRILVGTFIIIWAVFSNE